jgi:hypothetical protein
MNKETLAKLIDTDMPPISPITEENKYSAGRGCRDIRIATGRIWTDKEFAERRKRALETPLP